MDGDHGGLVLRGGSRGIGWPSGGGDLGDAQEPRGARDRLLEGKRGRGDVLLAPVAGKIVFATTVVAFS